MYAPGVPCTLGRCCCWDHHHTGWHSCRRLWCASAAAHAFQCQSPLHTAIATSQAMKGGVSCGVGCILCYSTIIPQPECVPAQQIVRAGMLNNGNPPLVQLLLRRWRALQLLRQHTHRTVDCSGPLCVDCMLVAEVCCRQPADYCHCPAQGWASPLLLLPVPTAGRSGYAAKRWHSPECHNSCLIDHGTNWDTSKKSMQHQ